jgi:hypothetical protein
MHVIKAGHIDCAKDTREVLESNIAPPVNEGLRKIFGKVLVICGGTHSSSYLDDSPIRGASFDEHLISLPINVFLTGDLAFLSTLLGKENMSTAWCPWGILSKVQWSASIMNWDNYGPLTIWLIYVTRWIRRSCQNTQNI